MAQMTFVQSLVEQHCKIFSKTFSHCAINRAPMMTEDEKNAETRRNTSHAGAEASVPTSPQSERCPHSSSGPETDTLQHQDASKPSKRSKKEHVKRPMNAFMVWSVSQRKLLSKEQPKLHNTELSKKLGQMWKSLTEEEKQHFKQQADLIKSQHREKYPDYKYRPKRRKVPKLKAPPHECRPLVGSEEGSSTSSDSPRMPLTDDLILRSNCNPHPQMSPMNAAVPWYRWDQAFPASAASSTGLGYQLVQQSSEYPVCSMGYPTCSSSLEYCSMANQVSWPPQPSSPNIIDYQQQLPPPYRGPTTSTCAMSDYHTSSSFQENHSSFDVRKPAGTCSPEAYYCDTSALPPNRMVPFEECPCPGQCSIPSGVYHFAGSFKSEQAAEHLAKVQEFDSELAAVDGSFVDFPVAPNFAHSKPEIRLQSDGVALASPPTPPISPQVASSLHTIPQHPAANVYHSDAHAVMVNCSSTTGLGLGLQYSSYT